MDNLKLSIIIPAYNEEKNLKKGVLREVDSYLKGVDFTYEVLIVDDGSSDQTVNLVKKFIKGKDSFKLIENSHGGKAITVMRGMLEAQGTMALFTDMDQATPITEVEKFFSKLEEGFDIVIGSRSGRKGAPILRKLMAFGFASLRNIILGLPYKDTQCGFKAFSAPSRQTIFARIKKGWQKSKVSGGAVNAGFDVEILFLAKKMGFRVAEVEVVWRYVGTERVQAIRDSLEAIFDMLRIRINNLLGKYD